MLFSTPPFKCLFFQTGRCPRQLEERRVRGPDGAGEEQPPRLLRLGAEDHHDHPGATEPRAGPGGPHTEHLGQGTVQRPAVTPVRHAAGKGSEAFI